MLKLSRKEIFDLDIWIEMLKICYPLNECQVKNLCEKVKNKKYHFFSIYFKYRQKKFSKKSQIFSKFKPQ